GESGDPLVLSLDGDPDQEYDTTFSAGGSAVGISGNLTLTDSASSAIESATVTITNPLDGNYESLVANVGSTSITADYDATTGVLTLSGTDTVDHYAQVLSSITYNNTSASPDTTSRTITVVVSDGTNDSNIADAVISIDDGGGGGGDTGNGPTISLPGVQTG